MHLSTLLVAIAVVHASAATDGPSGSYCGTLPSTAVDMKITFNQAPTFSISGTVFDTPVSCDAELYSYSNTTMLVNVTNFANPSDCLNQTLRINNVDVSSLD